MNTNRITPLFNRLSRVAIVLAIIVVMVLGPFSVPSRRSSYIVQGANIDSVAQLVKAYGGRVTSQLDVINGVGVMLSTMAAERLLTEAAITAVTPNRPVKAAGDSNTPSSDYPDVVGADVSWDQGTNGGGIAVAVVDTGIAKQDGLSKGINGKSGRIVAWIDFVEGKNSPHDPNGHGTHIAGIIANSQLGADGEWNGVAPGVNLVGVRVLNAEGVGTYEQVIQGIQWAIQNKDVYNIKVMNLSLVSSVQSPYWADPLAQAVMQAWAAGITVVVAAGNEGPDPMTIGVPGNVPYVITVGAFTDHFTPNDWSDDYLAPFSAAGPTLDGFVKPDVVAPGAHMASIMLPSSTISKNHEANQLSSQYFSMAGTSQATAVVSGVAALILSRNPSLTPDQVKYRIMYTAFPWIDPTSTDAIYSIWQQGSGRVNALDAIFADISGSANAGMDIAADLAGAQHYEGYSYYDEDMGAFRLRDSEAGGFGTWAGGFGTWAGGFGTWAGGFGTWAGGFGTWAGGFGTWAGGFGTWAGGFGTWAGGFGTWAGGFGTWAGGFGTWAGYEPWAGTIYAEESFVQSFLNGEGPDAASASISTGMWVDEP